MAATRAEPLEEPLHDPPPEPRAARTGCHRHGAEQRGLSVSFEPSAGHDRAVALDDEKLHRRVTGPERRKPGGHEQVVRLSRTLRRTGGKHAIRSKREPGGAGDLHAGHETATRAPGGTERVTQQLPPMTAPAPMTVSPPRIVAFA